MWTYNGETVLNVALNAVAGRPKGATSAADLIWEADEHKGQRLIKRAFVDVGGVD